MNKLFCELCGQTNKGRYSTFYLEYDEGKKKIVTWCDDCRFMPKGKTDKKRWEDLQTPFWIMSGQKPKPRDIKLDKYLKHRGMTYADWRRERDYKEHAKYPSALKDYEQHINKYGTKNAHEPSVSKRGYQP